MSKVIFDITRISNDKKNYTESFSLTELELIYDALNEYPQWNDDEDDNPTSRIMSRLYNLIEV
jgi:hypothetical protein